MKRSWDVLTEEQRRASIEALIDFFATDRDEEIGVIAAGELLDVFLQSIGKEIYNQGVEDTKQFVQTQLESMHLDIEAQLKKE